MSNFGLERNGIAVGVDSSGYCGSMDLAGRDSCTVGKVGVYKTGVNSMVGPEGGAKVSKISLERKGKAVGVHSKGKRGTKSLIISTLLHEDFADI